MKKIIYFFVLIWIFMLFIPMFCVLGKDITKNNFYQSQDPSKQVMAPQSLDKQTNIKVYFHETQEIKEMNLDEYLKGVVTAEMPASYHEEALKAQAVAARSYTYTKYVKTKNSPNIMPEHHGADVCTDIGHCKAFMSLEDVKEKWGDSWIDNYYKKITDAVEQTDGEVLIYDSQPVNAVFHSASYGKTENAKDVWGGDVAYLKSVDSKNDIADEQLISHVVVTHQEFLEKLQSNFTDIVLPEDKSQWIRNYNLSEGGSVLHVEVGNKTIKGSLLRSIFGLKSSNFTITVDSQNVTFEVRGSGHGVGMSQHGANEMANEGSSYQEILAWYYQGTQISYWGRED